VSETIANGRYIIQRRLGEGGIGVVDEAWDDLLGATVAIKRIKPAFRGEHDWLQRFQRECRVLGRMQHPNIVELLDVDIKSPDGSMCVMEYVDGTAASLFAQAHPHLVVDVARQICSALAYAHAEGVVHRDVKPGNILVKPDGTVKLLDFGLARSSLDGTLTASDEILGTLLFIAPEQTTSHRVDGRADLYSFGVLLYEMLCGRPPYRNPGHATELFLEIVGGEPASPAAVVPSLHPDLDALVLRLLERSPERRCQSASEVLEALERLPR